MSVVNGTAVKINNLTFRYQGADRPAVTDVSMEIKSGECVLLCGKSGCGKTTVTRILNGLVPQFFKGELAGECSVLGLECGKNPIEDFVPLVGSVFQNPKTQYFNTNTTAELAFPCENVGTASEKIGDMVQSCADRYGLRSLLDRSIFRLSGGEKQKIAFGAATILSPKLLVLDEPTSNLDDAAIGQLHDMITELKKEGVTIVLAEHRLSWAVDFVDSYYFFENGELRGEYKAEEFVRLTDEELGCMGLRAVRLDMHRARLAKKMGAAGTTDGVADELALDKPVIGYSRKKPVYRVDEMVLQSGSIVGIMGHNGIGKSTLIRTITGLIKPLSGEIRWNGRTQKPRDMVKRSFLVMQDVNYQLFSDSVREEVMLDTDDREECDRVLEQLGLGEYADRHPMSLSGGQKQRVAIASAMVSKKQLIIMDEPTSGLDRYHMEQVGRLMQDLKRRGKMVVIITHDEELAASWCDRVYKMEDEDGI